MQSLYRFLWLLAMPILPLYLGARLRKGKEEKSRLKERYGYPAHERKGKVLWLHAASIGEVNSILPLIEYLHKKHNKKYSFLLTTASRNGQEVAKKSVGSYVAVQYLPLDYVKAARRFLNHYQPFAALWVEQELWPNLLREAKKRGTHLALINGRLTQNSMTRWQRLGGFSKRLSGYFDCVLAGSPQDRDNFKAIGFEARYIGNLKALARGKAVAGKEVSLPKGRRVWLAASLHKNEERLCFEAHKSLQKQDEGLFLVLVPRYPDDSRAMQAEAKRLGLRAVLHSEATAKQVGLADCLIVDSFGVLRGLYKSCGVAFLGGSLGADILGSSVGGHNPLEAISEGCFVITGRDMHNFSDVSRRLDAVGSLQFVDSVARSLQGELNMFLSNDSKRLSGVRNGEQVLRELSAEAEQTASFIGDWLEAKL